MEDDTPTAILTKGQREYLVGEKNPVQERTLRTRMRRRVQIAIIEDVPLLEEEVDPEDLLEGADLQEFRKGLEASVRFVYQLARAAGHDPADLFNKAVRGPQERRADEIWEALEAEDIRAGIEELKILRDGGRISLEAFSNASTMCKEKPEGLTLEDIFEAWREAKG